MVTVVILLAMFIIAAVTVGDLATKWYMIHVRAFVGLLLTMLLVLHRGDNGQQLITSLLMMIGAYLAGTFIGAIIRPPRQAPNGGQNNH